MGQGKIIESWWFLYDPFSYLIRRWLKIHKAGCQSGLWKNAKNVKKYIFSGNSFIEDLQMLKKLSFNTETRPNKAIESTIRALYDV